MRRLLTLVTQRIFGHHCYWWSRGLRQGAGAANRAIVMMRGLIFPLVENAAAGLATVACFAAQFDAADIQVDDRLARTRL